MVYGAIDAFREWVKTHHSDLEAVIWSSPRSAFYTTSEGVDAMLSIIDEYVPQG